MRWIHTWTLFAHRTLGCGATKQNVENIGVNIRSSAFISLPTIIRIFWMSVSIPLKYAESAGRINSTIALMVGKLQAKMYLGLISQNAVYHSITRHYFYQKHYKGVLLNLFSMLNRPIISNWPCARWSWCCKGKCCGFWHWAARVSARNGPGQASNLGSEAFIWQAGWLS